MVVAYRAKYFLHFGEVSLLKEFRAEMVLETSVSAAGQ